MIRLLIADDHALIREGLKQLFTLEDEVEVVAEASHGGQVLDALRAGGIDLVLLDITMPGISGVNLIQRILAHASYPPVLVLTMHNEPPIARRILAAGASGYLTKYNKPDILMAAIRKVAAGGRFIDPEMAEQMVFEASSPAQRLPHEVLSNREFHILRLLGQGNSVNEAAEELSISNKTVSTHKARLMQKMRFQNNAEIVRYVVTYNLKE
ncbi:response regulator transcription factor [Massilia sp. CCM 9210]|uniref:response regulator n=1 Tax=Massilia scottii TaxID=3057166 RepID=UPI0027964375|nr:response regulator transcription factor [Massilia sp. CCM 9210]MDQ1815068.1 response regulator transcription factor [Massilia sp. CCM 9210]